MCLEGEWEAALDVFDRQRQSMFDLTLIEAAHEIGPGFDTGDRAEAPVSRNT